MELETQKDGIYTQEMWRHMSHIGCWISKDNEILTRFTLKEFNLCGRTLIQFVYISYFPIHLDVLAYMGHPYLYTSIITKMSAYIPVIHHCRAIISESIEDSLLHIRSTK